MKTKQIIIDKDAFVGIKFDDLCDFVKNHSLILPICLYAECATNEEEQQKLLDRFHRIVSAGGYICPGGRHIVEKEGSSSQPYSFLADYNETKRMREKRIKGYKLSKPDDIGNIHKEHMDSAQVLIDGYKKVVNVVADEKYEAAAEEVKKSQADRQQRFNIWIHTVDSLDIHGLAVKVLANFTNSPNKYCLSADWVTWHYLRIITTLFFEYKFRNGRPGKKQQTNAEHDLHDAEYVFLLSKADCLLTRDKRLVRPLAQAAFPEKDVFSSLDKVPDEYLCNWS